MESVTHRGRETAYVRADEGTRNPGLLFVHGCGASHEVWDGQRALADRWPVAAIDLSGHGRSSDVSATPGYASLSAYADDVLAVADEIDARVLVGNSLGGAVVMHALIERDPPVDAAVLAGTGARLGVLEDLLVWLEADFERAVDFLHGPGRLFADPNAEGVERSRELMRECGRRVTRRDFLTCHHFDERDRISRIDVPTLVVFGADDRLTPRWFHEYLAEEIPEATLARIDEAAQLSMLERPEAFNDVLAAFLESAVPARERTGDA